MKKAKLDRSAVIYVVFQDRHAWTFELGPFYYVELVGSSIYGTRNPGGKDLAKPLGTRIRGRWYVPEDPSRKYDDVAMFTYIGTPRSQR